MAKRTTDQTDHDTFNQSDFDNVDMNTDQGQKGGQSDTYGSDIDESDLDQ